MSSFDGTTSRCFVTLDNFEAKLPEILLAIREATFIAVDTEFTALRCDKANLPSLFDTIEERYEKARHALKNVAIIQLGVALFHMTDRYNFSAKCYNLLLFPRHYPGTAHDPSISLQASCRRFLVRHGFDYSSWVQKGISYANREEVRKLELELGSWDRHEADAAIRYTAGASVVFDELVASKKTLVGHNLFNDLVLLHASFYEPLPKSFLEYKRNIQRMFPSVIDTKYVAFTVGRKLWKTTQADIFDDTGLELLYESLKRQQHVPLIAVPNDATARAHEASYDAYMAGCVFLFAANTYAVHVSKSKVSGNYLSFQEAKHALREMINKVNVIRARINTMDLSSDEAVIGNRPGFLVVTSKRGSLDATTLNDVLSRIAGADLRDLGSGKVLLAPISGRAERVIREKFAAKGSEYRARKFLFFRDDPFWGQLTSFSALLGGALVLTWSVQKFL